ncbi:SusC/RagA family TonB-linked outer membrane protein [Puia dinghuensis]|uniref:SusC/RagA family TonB-linked outer membrane protein n=1 Tax=Puia dinghuensis TaxID=1792502 RepID=A0A8J2UDU8_9BACT|nr:TonB-dependent receptor [Puia dinghuensis]GGB03855.1 SusC/RagA family TonB-linked outer membrane protein [Puia dinghuensis]
MNKRLLARMHILLFLLCLGSALSAQKRTITGKVTDAKDGTPLAGVSVQPKGSPKNGVVTGSDGSYSLSVDANTKTLLFSFIGYGTLESPIEGGPINIALTAGTSSLNEVVVIGYGTVRKKDLTGAVAIVSEKDFQKGSITTPEQMIAGKLPGVSIISNSGQPGAGSTIRIRGGSSLNASNDPLIVIDGVPMTTEVLAGQTSTIAGASNPLSFINPNDIESFTVLKDASASAIYGTRAANGVILITTKKGRGGALKVSLSSVNSIATLPKEVSVLSPAQFRAVVNANGTAAQKAMLGGANTNWQDQIYQDGVGTNNNVSVTGGIKGLPYRLSVGYQDQNGILKTDNLQRTSAALNLNPVLFDKHLKVDLHLQGSIETARFGNTAAIGGATSFDPTQPVYTKSNRFGGYYEWLDPSSATGLVNLAGRNPLGLLEEHFNKGTPQRSIGNIQLDYSFHFLPELHANLNAGYDISTGKGSTFIPDSAAEAYIAGGTGGSNNPYKVTNTNTLFEFYLSYAKELKAMKSHFDVLAGYSYNNYLSKIYYYPSYYASGAKVPNSDPAFSFDKPEHTLLSYFGRANYSFEDKYLLTATIRRDGSSRFGPTNKYGNFPSVALAWRIKSESFLRNVDGVSDLKLRAGYGITGQQDGFDNYLYMSTYTLSNPNASYQFANSYYQGYRPGGYNPSIKWEQTATSNLGLDYGFLDGRITGSVDFYYKKTTNLLVNIPQPAGSNFSAFITANVGEMNNKGVEFNINLQPIRTKDLTWDVGFNVTYNKNKITRLTLVPNDTSFIGFQNGSIAGGIGGQFALINAVGGTKNTFYLYRQVYNTSGQPIEGVFVDKNGDGIINQQDLYKSKPADPQAFLGFSTNVTYRRFNAGFVLRASLGNYNYNNIFSQTGTLNQILGNSVLYNASSNYLATHFKGGNAQELLSDYYIQNASFLRMDNINVGYNVGTIYHTHTNLRLNAGVQNVFVITKYTGLDPEIAAGTNTLGNPGIDNNLYPRPRTYFLGLNLDF